MNFKSDITKSKILSNVESDGTALYYKSSKLNKINDNFAIFFKKKIKFSSAFDHIGSKQFLSSKKAALEQIKIDDNSISSNNEETQSNSNKKKDKKREKYRYRKSDDYRPKSSKNILESTKKKKIRRKTYNKIESKSNSKSKSKEKEYIIKTIVTKELDLSKKLDTCFSSQEIKMFKDEEINKIKPIKSNFNKMKTNKENNHLTTHFPFVGSENSIDSIFKVVSEMGN